MINLAHSSEGNEFQFSFSTSEVPQDFTEVFECLGKDDKCLETLLGENVFRACMERQPISK